MRPSTGTIVRITFLILFELLAALPVSSLANACDETTPIVTDEVVFEEKEGVLAI